MPEEKIMTLHPNGKQGVNILKRRYDVVAEYILSEIGKHKQLLFQDLCSRAIADLSATFDGKVGWYVVTVKLDLEARGTIERVPKTSPHELRLRSGN